MRRWLAGLAVLLGAACAHGAGFPQRDKPVTIVVPFPADGTTDRVARDFAEALHRALGTPVGVENVAGAAGSLGADKVARAAPDGYTLLLHNVGIAAMPALVRNLPFQVDTAFEPLGMVDEMPMVLLARPALPVGTPEELARWAADNTGRMSIGHAGTGSPSQLCALLVERSLRSVAILVPYKATAAAFADLAADRVDLLCDQHPQPHATADAHRPKVIGGPQMNLWHALYAPHGTPPEVRKRLNEGLRAALKDPEFLHRQEAMGAVAVTDARLDPGEHRRFVAAETAKWSPIIKAAGIFAE